MITNKKLKKIKEMYESRISDLKNDLAQARDLKEILIGLKDKEPYITTGNGLSYNLDGGCIGLEFDDTVAVYVDDMLGGQVIKQEATKAIKINQEGKVETGYTKQKPDKGFSYKLIRNI